MQHWIFDFDGTLVDTDGLFSTCLTHALEPYSVVVGSDFMEQIRHKHPHRIFEDLLSPEQADQAMQRMREIGQELSEKIQVFPNMKEILISLEKKKASLSIWTGRDGDSTHRILKKLNMDHFFEKVISGTCVEVNKPHQEGLWELKNHFNSQTDQMVMVGDHHHDIEPANQMGMISIHARWKKIPHVLPEGIEPRHSFDCTRRFFDWIQQTV